MRCNICGKEIENTFEIYGVCYECEMNNSKKVNEVTEKVLFKAGERDWEEDFPNFCKCVECGEKFIGHKRRLVCRKYAKDEEERIDKITSINPISKEEALSVRLCNLDIAENFQDIDDFCLVFADFKGAFAYWVAYQNPNDTYVVDNALKAFSDYIRKEFKNIDVAEFFSYKRLSNLLTEDKLGNIPEILKLSRMKPDFIDLGALARNVFYMIIRLNMIS